MAAPEPHPQTRATDSAGAWRVFGLAFVGAVAFYVVAYWAIEHWRPRKGPWEVTFDWSAGQRILINQHRLGITNQQVTFVPPAPATPETKRPPVSAAKRETIRFDRARAVPFDLPFGRCIFLDTTVLPGTVTMQLNGRELELMPRVLILDHREHPWRSNSELVITNTDVLPPPLLNK